MRHLAILAAGILIGAAAIHLAQPEQSTAQRGGDPIATASQAIDRAIYRHSIGARFDIRRVSRNLDGLDSSINSTRSDSVQTRLQNAERRARVIEDELRRRTRHLGEQIREVCQRVDPNRFCRTGPS